MFFNLCSMAYTLFFSDRVGGVGFNAQREGKNALGNIMN